MTKTNAYLPCSTISWFATESAHVAVWKIWHTIYPLALELGAHAYCELTEDGDARVVALIGLYRDVVIEVTPDGSRGANCGQDSPDLPAPYLNDPWWTQGDFDQRHSREIVQYDDRALAAVLERTSIVRQRFEDLVAAKDERMDLIETDLRRFEALVASITA